MVLEKLQQKLLQRAKGKETGIYVIVFIRILIMKSKRVSSFHFKIITVEIYCRILLL